jgi:serine/threonine protein phosphatase 1
MRLYIIGDIHGRSDLLDQMVEEIYQDIEEFGDPGCVTITLGDYVDRGMDSRGVLNRLARNPFPTKYIALKGNHEALLEKFLHDSSIARQWRELGGLETLYSYGISTSDVMLGRGFDRAAHALREAVPAEHLAFLRSLRPSVSFGDYFFCHAGVRPNVPLDQQSIDDLLWIRDEFLSNEQDFGKVIVHGHSPNEWPQVRLNRINIDTGAFATGRLTCLVLERDSLRFLYTA